MSVAAQSRPPISGKSPEVPADPIWRLSVEQYHEMVRAGILTDDDPVELLEGWLVVRMPRNPPHRLATRLTRQALERHVPGGWYVEAQEPITTDDSEPEPDVVVVRGDPADYGDRHPGPSDVAMVVEVADTTLQRDRVLKQRLYASAGIPVYWILNLSERQLEVYTLPSGPGEEPAYHERRDYGVAEEAPLVVSGGEVCRIGVGELLP